MAQHKEKAYPEGVLRNINPRVKNIWPKRFG